MNEQITEKELEVPKPVSFKEALEQVERFHKSGADSNCGYIGRTKELEEKYKEELRHLTTP